MSPPDFVLLPTGVGQQQVISTGKIVPNFGGFLPDSKRIVFDGHETGHASRVYVTNAEGGPARAITPEGFTLGRSRALLAPDGKFITAVSSDGIYLVSLEGSQPQLVPGSQAGDVPLRWSKDGQALFLGRRGETECTVSRLDLRNGARTAWRNFSPSDVAGIIGAACPLLAADEEHYVFGYRRNLSDLFLVEHLK
jgi:hypothetical protein